jgi:hypothetical protein
MSHRPKQVPSGNEGPPPFRMTIKLGECVATSQEVEGVISGMRADWPGSRYHLLRSNCNSFAEELAIRLCGVRIPGWVNRAASLGASVDCLLPAHLRAANSGSPVPPATERQPPAARMPDAGGHSLGGVAREPTSTSGGAVDEAARARAVRAEAALRRLGSAGDNAAEAKSLIPVKPS